MFELYSAVVTDLYVDRKINKLKHNKLQTQPINKYTMLLGSGWFSYSPPICWLRLERADENWKYVHFTTFAIGYATIDGGNGPSIRGRFLELHGSNGLGRCFGYQQIRACD